jgi:predicted Zn finger-like uncharacterized protein
MSLLTRCAHCHTVFRITPEQLQTHGGQVRCGRCMQVFNGLAALVPDMPAAPAMAEPVAASGSPAAVPPSAPTAAESQVEAAVAVAEPAVAAPPPAIAEAAALTEILPELPLPSAEPTPDATPEAMPESSPAAYGPQPAPKPRPPAVAADGAENPFIHDLETGAESGQRRPWLAAASILLAAALAGQAVYFYRGEIAARHPLVRHWLAEACAYAGCTLPLPQSPKAILIEASDLQAVDPANPTRIQLTATLRNHAGHDVAYPALDLVLTNANDHTLARRIFLPVEYLGSGRDPRAGIAANAELTVRLALETGNLGAAGFRLAVLPAPR